jgi:hypothetical protein
MVHRSIRVQRKTIFIFSNSRTLIGNIVIFLITKGLKTLLIYLKQASY